MYIALLANDTIYLCVLPKIEHNLKTMFTAMGVLYKTTTTTNLGCVYHHTSGVESMFPNDFQGDFCR